MIQQELTLYRAVLSFEYGYHSLILSRITFFLGITGMWEGWVPIATDLFYNGEFNGASCGLWCTLLNTVITHNGETKFFHVMFSSRDVRSYSKLNISGTFFSYATGGTVEFSVSKITGASSKTVVNVPYIGSISGSFAVDIKQVTQFNSDCYLSVSSLKESSDWTSQSQITHIWLS